MRWNDRLSVQRLTRSKCRRGVRDYALLQKLRVAQSFEITLSVNDEPTTAYVGGAPRRIDNMKRTIVVLATTLILTAGQAMAEGLTPPGHVNGLSLGFRVECICGCLDGPDPDDPCCTTCRIVWDADNRPHEVGTAPALSHHPRELSVARISPNTARPKQSERTTNRNFTPIPCALSVPAL